MSEESRPRKRISDRDVHANLELVIDANKSLTPLQRALLLVDSTSRSPLSTTVSGYGELSGHPEADSEEAPDLK